MYLLSFMIIYYNSERSFSDNIYRNIIYDTAFNTIKEKRIKLLPTTLEQLKRRLTIMKTKIFSLTPEPNFPIATDGVIWDKEFLPLSTQNFNGCGYLNHILTTIFDDAGFQGYVSNTESIQIEVFLNKIELPLIFDLITACNMKKVRLIFYILDNGKYYNYNPPMLIVGYNQPYCSDQIPQQLMIQQRPQPPRNMYCQLDYSKLETRYNDNVDEVEEDESDSSTVEEINNEVEDDKADADPLDLLKKVLGELLAKL